MSVTPHDSTPTTTTWDLSPGTLKEKDHYVSIIDKVRSLGITKHELAYVANLFEIEDLAREEMKKIGDAITKEEMNWNPDFYHRDILRRAPWPAKPWSENMSPDAFFSRFAKTKARLILRLTGKVILPKVKLLPWGLVLLLAYDFDNFELHDEVNVYLMHFDKHRHAPILEKPPRKRQRGQQCSNIGSAHH
jgi:hypothetical protein